MAAVTGSPSDARGSLELSPDGTERLGGDRLGCLGQIPEIDDRRRRDDHFVRPFGFPQGAPAHIRSAPI